MNAGKVETTKGEGEGEWKDRNYVKSNDGNNASVEIGKDFSGDLLATKYGFSIPTNATINGVQVIIGRKTGTVGRLSDSKVQLLVGGTATGDNKKLDTNWLTSETAVIYGSSSDLWNKALTPAIINNDNFGVFLKVKNSNVQDTKAFVNYIQIIVSYSIAGTLNSYTVSSGGTTIHSGDSFNPVVVNGSGLKDTNTPGSTTYYVECSLNPGCRTPANFVINAVPPTPKATNTNATCASVTGSITITSPKPADRITFTVTGANLVVAAETNTTGVFSGLAVGTYNLTAKNASGFVSLPFADVVIKPLVTNTRNGKWPTGSAPSSDAEEIIFEADYDTKSEDLTACTVL
jgi:hypothetical protein